MKTHIAVMTEKGNFTFKTLLSATFLYAVTVTTHRLCFGTPLGIRGSVTNLCWRKNCPKLVTATLETSETSSNN